MGFRNGAYAKIWEIKPQKDGQRSIDGRLSVSAKDKSTGEYKQTFSGFVRFVGAAAEKAKDLTDKDRIRLGDVDVTTNYVKETNTTYTNYTIFDFEIMTDDRPISAEPFQQAAVPQQSSGSASDDDYPF